MTKNKVIIMASVFIFITLGFLCAAILGTLNGTGQGFEFACFCFFAFISIRLIRVARMPDEDIAKLQESAEEREDEWDELGMYLSGVPGTIYGSVDPIYDPTNDK